MSNNPIKCHLKMPPSKHTASINTVIVILPVECVPVLLSTEKKKNEKESRLSEMFGKSVMKKI